MKTMLVIGLDELVLDDTGALAFQVTYNDYGQRVRVQHYIPACTAKYIDLAKVRADGIKITDHRTGKWTIDNRTFDVPPEHIAVTYPLREEFYS